MGNEGGGDAPRMPTRFTIADGSISRMTPPSTSSSRARSTVSSLSSILRLRHETVSTSLCLFLSPKGHTKFPAFAM